MKYNWKNDFVAFSGKAPPNLAQGVPPLLANQYIMGPGGLLPAYPVNILIKIRICMCVLVILFSCK